MGNKEARHIIYKYEFPVMTVIIYIYLKCTNKNKLDNMQKKKEKEKKNHCSSIILIGFRVHDYATDIVHAAICVLTGDKLIITYPAKPVHREAVNIVKLQ